MHCSDWPHGRGLIDVGLGLARFFLASALASHFLASALWYSGLINIHVQQLSWT